MATSTPGPSALWDQAYREKFTEGGGAAVRERFLDLMREHGHLVERQPGDDGNLPCAREEASWRLI